MDRLIGVEKYLQLLAAFILCSVNAFSGEEVNPARGFVARQYFVPAPDSVTIDGSLEDWDLSATVELFRSLPDRERRNGRLAFMYDEESIYISGMVADESPLMNRHDPEANPEKVWNGDSIQVRLVTDREAGYPVEFSKYKYSPRGERQIVHLLLWYYTTGKRPGLQLRMDMDYKLPEQWGEHGMVTPDGFDAAYVTWENGKGYTFEYRVPWKTLEAPNHPRAGDVVAGTHQINWSRADGLSIDKGGWARQIVSGQGFPFQASNCWGKFIFSRRNNLPDELVKVSSFPETRAEMPKPLELEFEIPRPGQVSLGLYDESRMLVRQVLAEAEYEEKGMQTLAWDGLDVKGKPLPAGTYSARGIVSDPITERFVLSVHNAGDPPYKTDDNTGGWGADHGEPTTVEAVGDKLLLAWEVAESGWGIIRTTLEGKKEWGTKHPAAYLTATSDRMFAAGGHGNKAGGFVRVYDLQDFRPITFDGGASEVEVPAGAEESRTTGLAAYDTLLYVAYGAADLIGKHDNRTGKLLATYSIPSPGRLDTGPKGTLYALSEDSKVVRVTDKPEVVHTGLDHATGIAVDGQGRVYVTQCGQQQNVAVIDGKEVRAIGNKGGRPRRGRFDPQGMLEPGGCAIDADGRLWVAETLDGPKRVSVWDTGNGENLNQFFGASSYFGWAWIEPARPGEAYCHNCLWDIDLDTGAKQIVSTHWRKLEANEPPAHNPGGHGGHFRVLTADKGQQFGWGMAGRSRASILYMRDGVLLKPIAGQVDASYPALKTLWEKLRAKWKEERVPRRKRPRKLFWQDANNDQKVSPDEVVAKEFYISWITPDMTLWSESGQKLSPVRFEDGKPVYDPANATTIPMKGRQHNTTGMAVDDPADGVYTLWPDSEHSFAKWQPDGTLLWSVGHRSRWHKALSKPPMKPGDLWGMTNILGLAGDFTGVSTYFGGYHLFTRDGIYVCMVMRPGTAPGGMGHDITASETLTGQLVKPDGMERWFLCAGDQDGRVTELHGLDTVARLPEQTVEISADESTAVAEANQTFKANQQRGGLLFIQRPASQLEQELAVIERKVDETRFFQAQLGWDEKYLYARYEVISPSPLVNSIEDPTLLFKGGNLIDLQLATNPQADPERTEPVAGDIRLLISRNPEGETLAVLLRPKAPDTKGKPVTLKSPTGEETFDAIVSLDNIAVDVEPLVNEKKQGIDNGFVATARIPLDVLGFSPASGQSLRMDIGYIFGNEPGTDASVRAYWHNNSFTANVVDDVPHESRLEPDQWGTALVE